MRYPFTRGRGFLAKERRSAFTLVELLVVIGIVGVLVVVAIVFLNPSELLKQGRDASRVSSVNTIAKAVGFYYSDAINSPSTLFLGTPSVLYISLADPSATSTAGDQCQGISANLPSLATGWTYHCVSQKYLENIDGTGWVPVNFKGTTLGTSISSLPIDPSNSVTSGQWYRYTANGNQYQIATALESKKYNVGGAGDVISGDGSADTTLYERGTNLAFISQATSNTTTTTATTTTTTTTAIAWWKFDEGAGTTAYDSAGTANGTIASPHWVAGKVGSYAIYADGDNTAITVGSTSVLDLTGNMSISAWANFSMQYQPSAVMVMRGNGSYDYFLGVPGSTNEVEFCIKVSGGNRCAQSATTYNDGLWHLFDGVFNGSNVLLYVDGNLAVTGSSTAGPITDPAGDTFYMAIGPGSDQDFTGSLDDVRVYNTALTASQVSGIYNGTF